MAEEELNQPPEADPGDRTSDAAKWKRIVECGRPDYLDSHSPARDRLPDGRAIASFPLERERYREEVQRVARCVYESAATVDERKQLVRDYIAQFPHLAFDPNSWFWNVYWVAKARGVEKGELLSAQELFQAVVNGIKAVAPGWLTKEQYEPFRVASTHLKVAAAKSYLQRLKANEEWQEWYVASRETHPSDTSVAKRAGQLLARLSNAIADETSYKTSPNEIRARGLAAVLSIAVSKKFSVREHNLHHKG